MVATHAETRMADAAGIAVKLVEVRNALGLFLGIGPPRLNVEVRGFFATGARVVLKALNVPVRDDV